MIIDSLNGYLNAMPEERFLVLHLHELLSYLGSQGVTTLLIVAQHGIIGAPVQSPVDVRALVQHHIQIASDRVPLTCRLREGAAQVRTQALANEAERVEARNARRGVAEARMALAFLLACAALRTSCFCRLR